ncbi:hypothetical protein Tco_1570722 [Tanacetum coccineum]
MEDSSEDNHEQKKPKSKVDWKSISVVKTFLEAFIHAIALDGQEGVSLKVFSWKKVAKVLKDTITLKQMINHFDYMKLMYGAWLSLKNRIELFDGTMATCIKTYETRSNENVRVVEPLVVEDLDDTKFPNTSSLKATSKSPSKVPCCV